MVQEFLKGYLSKGKGRKTEQGLTPKYWDNFGELKFDESWVYDPRGMHYLRRYQIIEYDANSGHVTWGDHLKELVEGTKGKSTWDLEKVLKVAKDMPDIRLSAVFKELEQGPRTYAAGKKFKIHLSEEVSCIIDSFGNFEWGEDYAEEAQVRALYKAISEGETIYSTKVEPINVLMRKVDGIMYEMTPAAIGYLCKDSLVKVLADISEGDSQLILKAIKEVLNGK
tara:strand:+ start:2503 stop:3177 length:675 start_codon:yes stop_codon:yes gene_type:complete